MNQYEKSLFIKLVLVALVALQFVLVSVQAHYGMMEGGEMEGGHKAYFPAICNRYTGDCVPESTRSLCNTFGGCGGLRGRPYGRSLCNTFTGCGY